MDRRLKRGRRKGSRQNHQRSPIITTAIKQQQKIASRKAAERAKLQSKPLPLGAGPAAEDSDQSESEDEEKEEDGRHPADTALIELASFPGYDPDHLTPLPHGLVPLDQLKRVTSAQTRLTSKREGFRESWKKLFYSSASLAIYQDYFWWYFLHRYQAGQHPVVQDLLFARISNNYVRLLCEPVEERWRGAFFKLYPDVVAQSVYSTYIHAYPTSWNSFDDEFKTELCQFISLWQVGTKPLPNSWEKWELSLLEPPNLLKHVVKEDQKSSPVKEPPSRRGTFNLDSLIREAHKRESEAATAAGHGRTSQTRHRASTISSTCTESQKDGAEERRPIIMVSDVEKALCSPSASQQKLKASPRSSTASRKGLKSESKERLTKERAREQLSSLKKIVMDKTSSEVMPQNSSTREQKQRISHDKKLSSSSRQSTESKHGLASKQNNMAASPKYKTSVDGLHKGQQVGKKTNATDCKPESKDKEDVKQEQTWKEKAMALCAKKKKQDELTPLEGPGFEHSVFDVCGHSPLVKFFLKSKHLRHKKEHSTLVKRTEISEQPPAQAICYKDVLDQSKDFEKKNQAAFRRQYQRQRQSIAKYHQTRKESSEQHERNVEKVLSHKKEKQELSNELTFHVLTNHKYSSRAAVSKAVDETLDRLTPHK